MSKSSSVMQRNGGGTRAVSELGDVRAGEKSYVSLPPTRLHPEGEPVIVETSDGSYRYTGQAPQWTRMRVDRSSDEYKRAIREYNIRFTTHADGTVTAQKGGLYQREKKYKSMRDFRRDAEKRINSRGSYDWNDFNSRAHGNVTQIEAESFRTIVRNNSSSMAIKKIKREIDSRMQTAYTRYTALQDAIERIRSI